MENQLSGSVRFRQHRRLEKTLHRQVPGQRVNGAGVELTKGSVENPAGNISCLLVRLGLCLGIEPVHVYRRAVLRDFHPQAVFPGGLPGVGVDGGKKQLFLLHFAASPPADIMPYLICRRLSLYSSGFVSSTRVTPQPRP